MLRSLLLLITFSCGFVVNAQETRFFMPLEIQRAYEEGTRSWDGNPGENYWHNTADYTIEVTVNPEDRSLTGKETVVYTNNSPNSIQTLVVRLYNDVFEKGGKREMAVNPEDVGEGVELSSVKIDGNELNLNSRQVRTSGTNMYISLPQPLESGSSLTFSADWKQYVPLTVRRTGAIDPTSYFVAYWYPQIAVYDDVFGWDVFDYTFQTEMYNNLGSFDVKITAPTNFTVWATGTLQNAEEVLQDEIYANYQKALKSVETVDVISKEIMDAGVNHKSGTWHYVADEVPDFAFATSDHYLWDAAIQKVEDRDVLISTSFPAEDEANYQEVTSIQQKTMKHFSEDIPGVPYPYPTFTTFIGLRGGGMEFPMMANNAGPGRGVTIHELFHTYFPMYVRVNERRYAWMDEGWANYITQLVTDRYFEENDNSLFAGAKLQVGSTFGSFEDLPLITSTQFLDNTNYGYASYPLPQFVYSVLHHYLGDEKFLEAFRTYINRWAKKSPTPYDFFYTFEDVTGEDLSWFWKPWFFNYGYADIQIESFKKGNLIILNKGDRPVPVVVDVKYEDGGSTQLVTNAKAWTEEKKATIKVPNPGNVSMIMVNREIPDADDMNNIYPSLAEIYEKANLDESITGNYQFREAPVNGQVEMKEDALYVTIPQAGIGFYILPVGEDKFTSLDGSAEIEFVKEDGKYEGMNMAIMGYNLTSSKSQ